MLQIFLISQKHPTFSDNFLSEQFKNLDFKAKYLSLAHLPESKKLFIGVDLASITPEKTLYTKTDDPYYKESFFELGAKAGQFLQNLNYTEAELSEIFWQKQISLKNLTDFQLGIKQGLWSFNKYKKQNQDKTSLKLTLSNNLLKRLNLQWTEIDQEILDQLHASMTLCRELVDETPEYLNPSTIPQIVKKELDQFSKVELQVYNQEWLKEKNFHGVLAVGRASCHEPCLVHAKLKIDLKNLRTRKKVFILHSRGSNSEQHFYPSLAKKVQEYGWQVQLLQVQDSTQGINNWLASLQGIQDQLDENSIIVSHSLGSLAVARFLSDFLTDKAKQGQKLKLHAWHSVGGVFDTTNPDKIEDSKHQAIREQIDLFEVNTLNFHLIEQSINKIYIHHALNDEIVSFENALKYKQVFTKSQLQVYSDGYKNGHFLNDEPFEFEELNKLVCGERTVVLVGKGLTYDSGGLDIKTGGHMKNMKCDMAGSALMFTVLRTMAALEKISTQKTSIVNKESLQKNLSDLLISNSDLNTLELHWLTAYVENMVSGNSYKSDDILRTFSGQTIEVWNTDAEGRITLADVLSYATTFKPDYIVDAATLTGACIMANSEYFTGLMSNDRQLAENLMAKFIENKEYTVCNHFPEVLRPQVQGDLGEVINTSKLERQAGHITAGLFLSHFIDQNLFHSEVLEKLNIQKPKTYSWAHLDIAGSAFNNKKNLLNVQGATAHNLRGLVEWLCSL